jgi:hypothetical protein
MRAAICIALACTICRRVSLIQYIHFNFHSEAEGLISAVLSCENRKVQVEAMHSGHTGLPECRREPAFALACCTVAIPAAGIFAPREAS